MSGFTLDKTHSLAVNVSHENHIVFGPLQLDAEQWESFRLYNNSIADSAMVTLSLGGQHRNWFRFSKWRYCKSVGETFSLYIDAGKCSDTIWLRSYIPLDASLTRPFEAYVVCDDADYGGLDIHFDAVETFDADTDPYPDRAGQETENYLTYFHSNVEATQLTIRRLDPLPVPQTETDWKQFPVSDRDSLACLCDRNNPRVGYRYNASYRQKVFVGDRIPAYIHSQVRLQTNFEWTDSTRIILPPNSFLAREWALFSQETTDSRDRIERVAKFKRTVYEFDYEGSRFYIDNVSPIFSFSSQLCFFVADAIAILEPAGSNDFQELPYNKLYRYRSHRPIDYVQSFIPSPDILLEVSGSQSVS